MPPKGTPGNLKSAPWDLQVDPGVSKGGHGSPEGSLWSPKGGPRRQNEGFGGYLGVQNDNKSADPGRAC